MRTEDRPRTKVKLISAILLALFIVGLGAGGYVLYRVESQRIGLEMSDRLAAIGKLKAGQIIQLRQEWLDDSTSIAKSPFFRKATESWLKDPGDLALRGQFLQRLGVELEGQHHSDAFLTDAEGRVLVHAGEDSAPLGTAELKAVAQAIEGKQPVLSNLFRSPDGKIYLDAVAPISDADDRIIAVVILRSSAAKSLYPLIQSWPIPSDSAETLLVQQDGDDVVFLNDLRFRTDAALSFRIPLARSDLPGVHAALGEQWVFKGKDYRGVEVLAVLLSVPGSPWSMVAKVDSFEVLAELRYRGAVIAVFVVLFVLLTLVLAAFFYRRRQAGLYRKLYAAQQEEYKAEEKVRESEERYRQFFERAPFGIGIATLDGKVLSINEAMERITGFSLEGLKGTNLADIYMNPDDRAELLRILETSESVVDYPAMLKRKDGTRYQASLTLGIVNLAGQRVLQTLIQDITERKRTEEALIESREQLRALAGRLEAVREDEHTRISREVHDELGQALAVLKMDLDWVARRLPEVDAAGRDRTASMLHLVDDTIARVRRISTELRPGMLDDLGLLPSLEWQAREFADRTGLECKLDLGGEDLVLEPGLVTTLFRVSQELLTNVARHAGATWFRLGMHDDPDQLTLIVSDDGQGITPDQVSNPKSLGLLGMRERVGAWGGDVTFHGVAGKGTEITVRVPLRDQVLRTSDQRQLEFPIPRMGDGRREGRP